MRDAAQPHAAQAAGDLEAEDPAAAARPQPDVEPAAVVQVALARPVGTLRDAAECQRVDARQRFR
jgi:hypothetical protein